MNGDKKAGFSCVIATSAGAPHPGSKRTLCWNVSGPLTPSISFTLLATIVMLDELGVPSSY